MTSHTVILPGWGLGSAPLQAIADALEAEILDLPGYGKTPFTDYVDQAVKTLAEQLQPKTQLIGWSLGAQFALSIAAQFPDKVAKLALISGTPSFVQREGWPDAMSTAILDTFSQGLQSDIATTLNRFVAGFNRGDQRSKAVTLALLRSTDFTHFSPSTQTLQTGLHWLGNIDLRASLLNIQARTLLIHGSEDPLMPLAAAESMAKQIPDAKLVVMDGCAHAPFISKPEEFLTLLQEFLNE